MSHLINILSPYWSLCLCPCPFCLLSANMRVDPYEGSQMCYSSAPPPSGDSRSSCMALKAFAGLVSVPSRFPSSHLPRLAHPTLASLCFLKYFRHFPASDFSTCSSFAWNVLPDICLLHSNISFKPLFKYYFLGEAFHDHSILNHSPSYTS